MASRASPGAEKNVSSPVGSRGAGGMGAKSRCLSAAEIGRAFLLEDFERAAERPQRVERHTVAEGYRRERNRRRLEQSRDEVALDRGLNRHVEEEQPVSGPGSATGTEPAGGRLKERRAIGRRRGGELLVEPPVQVGQVGSTERKPRQRGGAHLGHADLDERARERAREPGTAGDRSEVLERTAGPRLERGTRGHGFGAEERAGRQAALGQRDGRQPRRELREAESMEPGRDAVLAGRRDRARQIVDRSARRADQQNLGHRRRLREELARGAQTHRGRRGFNQRK